MGRVVEGEEVDREFEHLFTGWSGTEEGHEGLGGLVEDMGGGLWDVHG